MTAPCILAFDTSGPHCAAALLRDGRISVSWHEEMARGQAERLMPLLQEVMQAGGVLWKDLDALGVGVGPGNFTGIRIAVSAARGLALGLGVPAIGVSTFEAIGGDAPILLGAPQGRAYRQDMSGDLPSGVPTMLASWDGETAMPDWAGSTLHAIARRAADRLAQGGDIPRPAPLYIRPADAAPSKETGPKILL